MRKVFNILQYIETIGPGGAETVLLDIVRNLERARFYPRVILHKSDWLHDQLNRYGIETEIIPSRRSWDLSFLRKFIGYCREHKIDLIHSHLFGANLYASLAGAILRRPVIATFHNELFLRGQSEKFLSIKSFIIRKFASNMVFVAEYLKNDYLEYGKFPANKMQTIYNGISLNEKDANGIDSALKKELGISDKDILIGHIANFRTPKGHRYLIEAASIVCEKVPDTKFLLVGEEGDGSIKNEVDALIRKFGIENNIRILGFRNDVKNILRLIDVFVLSSVSEGMPLSVIEAMAASKPVVVTNVGGMSEIVIPDKTGFMVAPRDPQALAEKLIALLGNKEKRKEMGQNGKMIAEEKFSLKNMIDNYQKLYEELVA